MLDLATRRLLHPGGVGLSLLTLLFLGILLSVPAQADDHSDPRNRASFQVEAVREVENDWTTARLSIVAQGKDPSVVASEVNTAMAKAVAKAKKTKGVEVRSGTYATQPMYNDGKIIRWQARQELRLEAGDMDRLAKLIGQLQGESVLLSSIDFSVRRETRKALEDELIAEALSAFRERASLIAKNMHSKEWSLIDVSVGSTNASPHRVMMDHGGPEMYSRAKSAAPSFEAGTSEIRVHASGVIELE